MMQVRVAFGSWALNISAGKEKQSPATTIYEGILEEVFAEDVGLIVTPTISLN